MPFAIIKLPVNVVNDKGQIIGQQTQDITRSFELTTSLADVQAWAHKKHANGCTIWFETPEQKD